MIGDTRGSERFHQKQQITPPPCIPYFVNFSSNCTGKHISVTKRHITWKFGFAPLPFPGSGTDCRGKEHEVKLLWSTASGKRHVMLDNRRTIHYSTASGHIHLEKKFEHSFSIGLHTIQIIARSMMTGGGLNTEDGNGRRFELLVDGQSVFDMLRIYELGEDVEECQIRYGDLIERFRYVDPPRIKEDDYNEVKSISGNRTMTTVAESDNMTLGDSHYFDDFDASRSQYLQEEKMLVQMAKQESLRSGHMQTQNDGDDFSTNTWELDNIPAFARSPAQSVEHGDNSTSRTTLSASKSLLGEVVSSPEDDLIDLTSPRELPQHQQNFQKNLVRPMMLQQQSSSGLTSVVDGLSPTSALTSLPFAVPPPPTMEQMNAEFGSFSLSPSHQSITSSHFQGQSDAGRNAVGGFNNYQSATHHYYQPQQPSYMPNVSAPPATNQMNSHQFSTFLGSNHYNQYGAQSEPNRRQM